MNPKELRRYEGERLRDALLARDMTQIELARALTALGHESSQNTLYNMVNGVTRITAEKKALIASILKATVDEIWPTRSVEINAGLGGFTASGEGVVGQPNLGPEIDQKLNPGPQVRHSFRDVTLDNPAIPVSYAMVEMRYAGEVPASAEWGDPLASETFVEMEAKFDHPKRFCARVRGQSCYPALKQGDMSVWHANLAPPMGQIVLAQNSQHQCTVKELAWDDENNRPVLVPINKEEKAPPDGDGWTVVAQLVGVIRNDRGVEKTWYVKGGLTAEQLES